MDNNEEFVTSLISLIKENMLNDIPNNDLIKILKRLSSIDDLNNIHDAELSEAIAAIRHEIESRGLFQKNKILVLPSYEKHSSVRSISAWLIGILIIAIGGGILWYVHTKNEVPAYNVARMKLETEVLNLLHQEKFSELENMANEFRTEKSRFSDGGWKLLSFYDSFAYPDHGWDDLFHNIDMWLKLHPNSITARVAAGEAWLRYAWVARGGGYANTVTKENWKLFHERIKKAYEFVKNPPSDSSKDCIHRYDVLLEIGLAQGWNWQNYEALFQEAVSYDPSYYKIYFDKTFYLLPRWGGEKGAWQKFASEAVKLTPESEGMTIYARILWTVWMHGEFTEFREPDISWEKMKQGFHDIDRKYPNSSLILNSFCVFACIARDRETARKLFKRIGNDSYPDFWGSKENFYIWQKWAGVSN